MISKTKIKSRIQRKINPELVETLKLATKSPSWMPIAKILSSTNQEHSSLNLYEIDKDSTAGDTIIIPGKVLSQGELTKKLKICALSISQNAKQKLKDTKSEFVTILSEIKTNPSAEGIKIIR